MLNKTSLVAEFVLKNKGDIVFRLILQMFVRWEGARRHGGWGHQLAPYLSEGLFVGHIQKIASFHGQRLRFYVCNPSEVKTLAIQSALS